MYNVLCYVWIQIAFITLICVLCEGVYLDATVVWMYPYICYRNTFFHYRERLICGGVGRPWKRRFSGRCGMRIGAAFDARSWRACSCCPSRGTRARSARTCTAWMATMKLSAVVKTMMQGAMREARTPMGWAGNRYRFCASCISLYWIEV